MKFYIERLGCPKNDVDADYITGDLIARGHEHVTSVDDADAVIVNTCGFILPAKQESIGELLRFGKLKKKGKLQRVIAAGCLSQLHGDELLSEIPELDGAVGHGQFDALNELLNGSSLERTTKREAAFVDTRNLTYLTAGSRFVDKDTPYAYLKISDGCDRKCSYCIIPKMRGSFRSRPIDEIVQEAEFLASSGKRELILVSQEATLYGADTGKVQLFELLNRLSDVRGIDWIRLMYLHPQMLGTDLITYLRNSDKVLSYYDLPLQHITDRMLQRMRRQVRREKIQSIIADIRKQDPQAVIRTTFIVGFPGETSEDFGELYDFVEDTQFDRMGVFAYSREEGSSANLMPDQIDEAVKDERVTALYELQQGLAESRNRRLIGADLAVLVDCPANGQPAQGRTIGDCPEIDQMVYLKESATGPRLKMGDLIRGRIVETEGLDLIAEFTGDRL